MAYDRIESPERWQSSTARLLYRLVCLWTTKKAPKFSQFFPEKPPPVEPDSEAEILAKFGIRPNGNGQGPS